MKKITKSMRKLLSVFLVSLIVMQILPLQVLAESITDAIEHKEFIEDVLNNPTLENNTSDAEILYEVEEKRDEYTKVYKKSDGTYTAIMTEEPLHYLNDGVWEEINNSMSLNGNLYTNLDNLFNVEFPESIDSNENLTVEKDGYELSFSVDEIEESSAVVENDIVVSDTNISVADEAISQTQSSVTYNDVAENTDLQYIVTPNSIKENIIVSNKESVKDTYTFTFETNGLNAEKLDDGSVVFKDENNEIKFRIPRPVMTDSSLAFSYEINVVLIENADGTITLEYSPSYEWTNNLDRVYPITIDPAIHVENNDVSWVEDTWVSFDSEIENSQYINGYNDCAGGVINQTSTNSNNETRYQNSEIYTKFNIDALKSLGNNVVFTEVQYLFVGASVEGKALAKTIESPVDLTTVTYATKPSLNDEIIDYYTSPYSSNEMLNGLKFSYIHFNLTKPLNEWYAGDIDNNGFAVVAGNEEYIGLFVLNGVTTSSSDTNTYTTAIVMDYVDMGGYNENLNYHTQSAGRAGTGYVNDFTQHLSILRDDISIDGSVMPVTVGMTYNSATYNKMKSLNDGTMMAYGNKWTPNYLRAFVRMENNQLSYFTENGSEIDYVYSVENGDVVFEEMYSSIYGDHEYEIEYFPATNEEAEYIVITRPDGYQEKFNDMGLLVSVTNPNNTNQMVNIKYDSKDRIDYIAYSNGREFKYIYCEFTNLLLMIKECCSSCTCATNIIDSHHTHDKNDCSHMPDNDAYNDINTTPISIDSCDCCPEINFTYDKNKNLKSVIYSDKKYVTYEYDSNNNLIAMTNIDGYRIEYDYEQISKPDENGQEIVEQTDKVTKAIEKAYDGGEYKEGKFITYERLNTNQIKLTDATGDYEIYHFGASGNLLYTINNNGSYVMHEDVDSTDETHFASVSDYRAFSENLLSNPSFEELDLDGSLKDWETSKIASMQSNDVPALFETKVLKISGDENESVNIKQTVDVFSGGGKYTFSAYVKSDSVSSDKLMLKVSAFDISNSLLKTESTPVESTNGKWERYTVTLNAPADTETIAVELITENGDTFYIDGVQLEQSSNASLYNYLSNGSFNKKDVDENGNEEYILDGWSELNNPNFTSENINGKIVNALVLPGGENEITEISQTIAIDGKMGDIVRVGGWFKGNYVKSETNNVWLKNIDEESGDTNVCNFTKDRNAYIKVTCANTNTNDTQTIEIPFNENIGDWQFIAREFSLDGIYDQATITVYYSKNSNSALLSNIELTKTKVRPTTYTNETKPCPCVNCTVIDCSCNCNLEEDICYCKQCMLKTENTRRDSFGIISLGNNYDEIVTSQLLSQRIGDNVTVNYNLSNGLYKSYVDAKNAFTSYDYNNAGVLTKISANGNEIDFTYENDRVTSINQNNTIYKFSYDSWGQITQINVGDTPVVLYEYGSNEHRDRVTKVTYYNDNFSPNITEFSYDNENNSIVISVNGTEEFICIFDANGSLIEIQEKDGRKIYYINDKIEILNGEDEQIYKFDIDTDGNYVETFGDTNFTTKNFGLYNNDCTYTDTVEVSSGSEKNIVSEAEFDATGRYSPSSYAAINVDDVQIFNGYIYDDNNPDFGDDDYSPFIAYGYYTNFNQLELDEDSKYCITYTGVNVSNAKLRELYYFIYKYDDNNNVIYESIRDIQASPYYECDYIYDDNNQLIRVNQISYDTPQTNNNTFSIVIPNNSVTYTYSYDNAGNLLCKSKYEYTTDADLKKHIPIDVEYGYDSENTWKDALTSFGNIKITYDNIGNPTKFEDSISNVTKQLAWNGKQLKSYTDGDKTINYEYDVNGLCYKKTVTDNGITEKYDYIWLDGKLTGQIYTDNTSDEYVIKYVYDLFNAPYGFIINHNNTEQMYLYLKNYKGDIIGIVNESGQMVISYEYDAWGVLTVSQHCNDANFANVISKLPITYRGYFYDYDTGLYYIQGRYYNPEWGRFINADSTSNLGSTGTALSYNLYAYCENNPVMYVVDNKNTAFSSTINANYLYNKRISKGITGYIDDQQNGIASKLRYGINTISPFGCGTVATYNALIMLGNRMDICDIIRDYEMNHAYHDGLIGTHGNNIARFFSEKGYKVTITNLQNLDSFNQSQISALEETISSNKAHILYYTGGNTGHFIAISCIEVSPGEFVFKTYNEDESVINISNSIEDFVPLDHQPYMLISISHKTNP